jgi:hypothetical protein
MKPYVAEQGERAKFGRRPRKTAIAAALRIGNTNLPKI